MQTLSPADKDYWKQIVASSNQLGIKLLPSLQGPGRAGNVVISPTSVFVLLCMLYNGSCNDTYVGLAQALGLPADKDLNPWMRQLINFINGHSRTDVDVQLINALWFASGEHLHFDFANTLTESYSASLYSIDFYQQDAVDRINSWAATNTGGKILQLIERLDAPPPRFIMTNAIYFLGQWVQRFDMAGTALGDFYLPDGGSKKTAMMSTTGPLPYFEDNECQSILLPYKNSNYALQVVLPRTMQSPMRLLSRMEELCKRATIVPPTYIKLVMPKFDLNFGLELQNTLGAVGVRDLSDPINCDFGRIGHNINVNRIIHRALVKVDELGTESPASASANFDQSRAGGPSQMTVDHPFIFSICDTVTGQILLLGSLFVP